VGKIDVIEQLLEQKNDATLKELCQGLKKKAGIKLSICYCAIAQQPFNFN
jgi:transposase